jgi:Spy/CpxP family protein refolding chaperone
MKNLFIALAIVIGLCLQTAAAQTDAIPVDKGKVNPEVAAKVTAELMKIDRELKLTEAQQGQLKVILTEQMEKLQEVYKEIEPKVQVIKEESRGKMRGVLTPEQRTKWDTMKSMDAQYGKQLDPVKERK